jgi:hypothetical protein
MESDILGERGFARAALFYHPVGRSPSSRAATSTAPCSYPGLLKHPPYSYGELSSKHVLRSCPERQEAINLLRSSIYDNSGIYSCCTPKISSRQSSKHHLFTALSTRDTSVATSNGLERRYRAFDRLSSGNVTPYSRTGPCPGPSSRPGARHSQTAFLRCGHSIKILGSPRDSVGN